MKRACLFALVLAVELSFSTSVGSVQTQTPALRTLYIDSLPRGADVYVADTKILPKDNDTPRDEKFYKGKTPLTLDVPPGEYAVHIQVPFSAFSASPRAKTIVDNYVKAFMEHALRGPYALGDRPENPFLYAGSNTTTFRYGRDGNLDAIGHRYLENVLEKDKRIVAIWWPKGLTYTDMEPLMPAAGEFKLAKGPTGTLKDEYKLEGETLNTVASSLERCGIAVASVPDPYGKPYVFHLVFWLGPPGSNTFSVTRKSEKTYSAVR